MAYRYTPDDPKERPPYSILRADNALIAPDALRNYGDDAYLEIRLWSSRGKEVARESLYEIEEPEPVAKANVLVEIVAAGQRKAQAYHANTLKLTLTENYGRLEARDSGNTQAPAAAAPAATADETKHQ